MKKIIYLAAIVAIATTSCNNNGSFSGKSPETTRDSISYALGSSYIKQFETFGNQMDSTNILDSFNIAMIHKGLQDAFEKKELAVGDEKGMAMINAYFSSIQMSSMKKKFEGPSKAFLEKNKTEEGVQTTPSGLQYKVITMGSGAKPTAEQRVKVNYKGTLVDGQEFDSSFKRNEPAEFGLSEVIAGWTEGIQMMPVGSKFIFYVPYDLGYGEQGNQGIPPYSTLIFEVELLEIVK